MSVLEAITAWLSTFAWPTVVVVLVFKLKSEIAAMLGKIGDRFSDAKSVKGPGGIEIEFWNKLHEVETVTAAAKAEGVLSAAFEVRGTATVVPDDFTDNRAHTEDSDFLALRSIANVNPAAAIIGAGAEVSVSLRRAFERAGLGSAAMAQSAKDGYIISRMTAEKVIDPIAAESVMLIIDLGETPLRHNDWTPQVPEAIAMVETAEYFAEVLNNLARPDGDR